MHNNIPLFIRLHSTGSEGMINVWNINAIVPYNDNITHIYLANRERPFCVDESYEEIKKKLQNAIWIV